MRRRLRLNPAALAERILRSTFSEDAAASILGDLVEDVARRRGGNNLVRFPGVWLIGQAILFVLLARRDRRGSRLIPIEYSPGPALSLTRQTVLFASVAIYELKHALRTMRKHPGFATAAVLSLAVGIGASTAIFSVVNAALLRDLPVSEPEALVELSGKQLGHSSVLSYPMVGDLGAREQVLTDMYATGYVRRLPAEGAGWRNERLSVAPVTGNFFSVLGLAPRYGRLLVPLDDERAKVTNEAVAVLSHSFWTRQFGADTSAIGKTLVIPPRTYSIVGIAPAGFAGDAPGSQTDVWVPLPALLTREELEERGGSSIAVMGRLRPGITPDAASAALSNLYRDLLITEARSSRFTALRKGASIQDYRIDVRRASRGFDYLSQRFARPLQILFGVVLLLHLIACCNFAGLLVARARADRLATAIRSALGATRSRLVVRGLIQSIILAVVGIVAGTFVASLFGQALLAAVQLDRNPIVLDLTQDYRVLGLGALLGMVAGLTFGFAPAWVSSRITLDQTFRVHGVTAGMSHRVVRRGLVIGQIAISLTLAFVAALMVKTLANLNAVTLGFDSRNVVIAGITLDRDPSGRSRSLARLIDLHERLNVLPDVQAASLSAVSTFSGRQMVAPLLIRLPEGGVQRIEAWYDDVSPGYFQVLRVPLLAGRTFQVSDGETAPRVAVVNDAFARKYFGARNPIGDALTIDTPATRDAPTTIVGVVGDMRYKGARHDAAPMVYFPIFQGRALVGSIEIRSTGEIAPLLARIRQLAPATGGNFRILEASLLASQLEAAMGTERTLTRLLAAFSIAALLLAFIGVYGLLSHTLTQLTPEIGVRMALGATVSQVVALVSREALWVVGSGLAVGLLFTRLVSGLVSAFLFDLRPNDPAMLAVSVGILVVVGAMGALVPIVRAIRIDPLSALRSE